MCLVVSRGESEGRDTPLRNALLETAAQSGQRIARAAGATRAQCVATVGS
jgi:hypothetical protein